jgi:hypothetical protein
MCKLAAERTATSFYARTWFGEMKHTIGLVDDCRIRQSPRLPPPVTPVADNQCHFLLVIAVVILIINLMQGRRGLWTNGCPSNISGGTRARKIALTKAKGRLLSRPILFVTCVSFFILSMWQAAPPHDSGR